MFNFLSTFFVVSANTPAQRVQFLLGTEDADEDHIPHALFTELDEICLREGEDAEWRETARYILSNCPISWSCSSVVIKFTSTCQDR